MYNEQIFRIGIGEDCEYREDYIPSARTIACTMRSYKNSFPMTISKDISMFVYYSGMFDRAKIIDELKIKLIKLMLTKN